MRKIVMILVAVFLGTTLIYAQPGGDQRNFDPEAMAKRQTEQLKEVLGLNKSQEKSVYDLNLETSKQMRTLREQSSGNFEGMREKMTKIREKQNEKMKEILTAEQWTKYQKYLEERRQQRGQRRPSPR